MKRTIKNTLAVIAFTLILTLTGFSKYSEEPINPEAPIILYPQDVVAFTYTDSWWDATANPNGKGYMEDEDGNQLPAYESGILNFHGVVSSDYNPWAASQCQWNQNMQLLDLSINQMMQMTGWSSNGSTSFGQWDFNSGDDFGPIRFQANVSIDSCPPEMPQVILTEPVITIIDGVSGTSNSHYEWASSHTFPLPSFLYQHTSSHAQTSCPAFCASSIKPVVAYIGRYPGPDLNLKLPFNKNGVCARTWVYYPSPYFNCYNQYDIF